MAIFNLGPMLPGSRTTLTNGLGGLFGGQPAAPASEFNAINNIGNFGGEIESARLDIAERLRRRTDSRQQSRLTLPNLIGDGEAKKNILADVL